MTKFRGIAGHLCSRSMVYWLETGQRWQGICLESTGNRDARLRSARLRSARRQQEKKSMFLKMVFEGLESTVSVGDMWDICLLVSFPNPTLLAQLTAELSRQSFLYLCSKPFLTLWNHQERGGCDTMCGIPLYKFHYGAFHTPLNSSPLQGQSSGKKKSENLKGLGNQQALPILAFS